jgi:hypothetical protein
MQGKLLMKLNSNLPDFLKKKWLIMQTKKVKLSLYRAMEAQRVVRRRGSHSI